MKFSKEVQEKINLYFKNNEELREKLLVGDADAIREVGAMSQIRITPEYVIEMCENGRIEELQEKAKLMIALKELYEMLCFEYSKVISAQYRDK